MSCKGICSRYKLVNIRRNSNQSYYSDENPDRKYCSRCECRLIWAGTNCMCCGFRLRTKPRNYKMNDTKVVNHTNISKLANIIIEHQPFDDLDILMPLPLMPLIAK